MIADLKIKLHEMQIGSCTCLTKTPELKYHAEDCRYRVSAEILAYVEKLEGDAKLLEFITTQCLRGSTYKSVVGLEVMVRAEILGKEGVRAALVDAMRTHRKEKS